MSVKLVAISQPVIPGIATAEDLMAYVARVSNPGKQIQDPSALLKYCIDHKHWSVFETVSMTIEIKTTRAIASQILRHRSFHFQEFSQRYAAVTDACLPQEARLQDRSNRQNSIPTQDEDVVTWWNDAQQKTFDDSMALYEEALRRGIARDCARFVLPLATPTTMYMTGTVRDFIHYIELRSANGTQKEHVDIAENLKRIFIDCFPNVSKALWS